MNRLALRLIRAGGVRPGLLLASSVVGMLLLLAALATPRAHDRQVWREAARSDPMPYTGSAPHLLWEFSERLPVDGLELQRAAVAETAAGAPAPLGATRVPRPGEIFVTAALARALRGSHRADLRLALPGRVTGRLSDAIVSRPGELIYMVGYTPSQLSPAVSAARPVRTFVPRDLAEASGGREGFAYTVGFAVLIAAALVTIALVIANASRVGARRRESRLSALRLAGADTRQVARVLATEAAITALPGALIGALIAILLRSAVESWPFGIWPILSRDLTLPVWELVAAVAALPVLAFTSALLAMRGAAIDPLGANRRTLAPRPRAARLLVPLAGWGLLVVAALVGDRLSEQGKELVAITGACIAAAGVAISGPWLAARCAAAARRLARGPAVLLGARQLQAHPRSAFRAVASLVLGLFVVSLSLTYFESHVAFAVGSTGPAPTAAGATRMTVFSTYEIPRLVGPRLVSSLEAVPGVRAARLGKSAGNPARTILLTTDGAQSTLSRVVGLVERVSPGLAAVPLSGYLPVNADDPSQIKRTLLDDAQSLLWILDALAAVSLAVAAIDGISDRRRSFAALTALGVPAGTLRRAVALEVLAPFAIAAVTAVGFGIVVGVTLVALTTHITADVPWSTLASWLGIAALAAVAATIVTATRVNAAIRPEHLRSE
jgi:hypothetical protein